MCRLTKSPPDKGTLPGIANVDLLDRVQTPERIEFSNLSTGNASSIHEDSLSQMDEDEWTDRNFGASCAEQGDSDDETSSDSDSDIDDEEEEDDAYDDALEDPEAKDGAAKWPDRWKHSYRRNSNDSDEFSSSDGSSYYENSSDDDESDTATEGEDEIRARELRRQEVQVEPPVVHTDTGTDTEIVSDESSSESSSEVQNSATEISTDSEFAQDDPTPTREMLTIALNDFHVTKTRGSGNNGVPRKIQVTSGYIQRPGDGRGVPKRSDVELKLKPLVSPSAGVKRTLPLQSYALNRTQSTGGMAAKVSLELKKKYLLGDAGNSIQKSGSATALDSKFKSFQSNITDCQKLLKPAPEVSNSMQTFCNIIAERKSPTYMTQHSSPSGIFPTLADSKQAKDGENEEKKMLSQNPPSNVTETETKINNEETEPLKKVIVENPETNDEPKNENVPEGRPRSPLHETSIIVPQIDWGKKNDVSSDSLNSSSDEDKDKVKIFGEIPTVTVDQAHEEPADLEETPFDSLCHVTIRKKVKANEEIKDNELEKDENVAGEKEKTKEKDDAEEELLDSLCIKTGQDSKPVYAEAVNKNVSSEKKSLNQPKTLPNLSCALPDIHKSLHLRRAKKDENSGELETEVVQKNSSGISSPESMLDQPTALTDTELSDWARDGIVSDDLEFEDIVVDPKDNQARNTQRGVRRKSKDEKSKHIADISEIDLDKNQHKKDDNFERNYKNTEVNEAVNAPLCEKTISEAINKSILGSNSDIAFMDTGMTESSSDADTDKNYSQGQDQGGYRLLKNDAESDFAEDSLNPCVNIEVFETRNENVWSRGKDDATKIEETPKNTGYCYLTDENEDLRENVSEATKSEVSKGLDDQNLLTVETGTTTEENTCSDSTVKPVTELNFDKENLPPVDIDKTPVAEIIDSITKDFNAANIIDNKELSNVRLTKEFDVKDKDTKKVTNADSGKSLATKSDKRKSRKDESVEFDERHQGLKSNVDFKNAKDSIDIRKARRRSKPDVMAGQPLQVQQKPDLIQEGSLPIIDSAAAKKKESMVLNLTPDILYRKNVIQKERDVNQRLVHEMVMNKMKTLERKSRERPSPVNTGNENMSLWRSKTATDLFAHRRSNLNESKAGASTEGICDSKSPTNVKTEAACSTPDVLLSTNILPRLQNSKSAMDVKSSMSFLDKEINEYNNALKSFENDDKRPVSVFSSFLRENEPKSMASMPEISDAPKAPPRYNKSDDISRKLEKLKQNVKVREKKRDSEERSLQRHSWIDGSSEKDPHGSKSSVRKSKSKEGEDKKVHRRNSWLYSANVDSKAKSKKDIKGAAASIEKMRRGSSESVLKVKRSKSFSEICDKEGSPSNIGKYTLVEIDADAVRKSDPNILELETDKKTVEGEKQSGGKKKKDRERRKSITKMFATLFTRKSPTGASKKGGLFAKLSPKSKEVSKSLVNLSELRNSAEMEEKPIRQKSLSETSIQRNLVTPPPIPPLPKNYHAVRMTDDSSDGELECRRLSSCDTLDHSGAFETSAHGSRSSNKAMKAARQSQAKRLRLAQEIQRKLQETEVKTKELEIKGVEVEKALRGECGSECDCAGKDETELLREWFALMRDRQELRRYERELTDRAKELELEDRYQRLGRDMRDKLSIEHDGQAEVGI
ncbi:unnamed protein product [Acanthoscelides obtectus]|uniref:BMERB domain-containing protein n=1 Tax=Acanthoscelides obtectus TaxID=200917 RepID=A0A9P0MDM1_ACAOB|nr:unnamed protein product [Acanthoscelides obtectus]CAK1630736.1 [F-actin]-monooxygenase Mical [Acanthoscelides obtectus]